MIQENSPTECFKDSNLQIDVSEIVKIGKICIHLHDPIWLNQSECADEKETRLATYERTDFDPRNQIVQTPR